MLRPIPLLPPKRLLTPRLTLSALALGSGPATGCSGSYPDGTFTRRLGPAFRTHHWISLFALPAAVMQGLARSPAEPG